MIKRAGGSYIRIIARSIIIRAPTLTMSAGKSSIMPCQNQIESSALHIRHVNRFDSQMLMSLSIQLLLVAVLMPWKTLSHTAFPHAVAEMLHNRISCHWLLSDQCHLDSETCHTLREICFNESFAVLMCGTYFLFAFYSKLMAGNHNDTKYLLVHINQILFSTLDMSCPTGKPPMDRWLPALVWGSCRRMWLVTNPRYITPT